MKYKIPIKVVNDILLLSGYSTSGKDLLADYIVQSRPFCKMAFATELKIRVSKKYDIPYNLTLTQKGKSQLFNGITIRQLLITEATKMRELDELFWVKHVSKEIKNKIIFTEKYPELYPENANPNVVISDTRFPNEIEYIKNNFPGHNVVTIRINRHTVSPVNSETEYKLDNYNFDYYIENNSDIPDFYHKMNLIFQKLEIQKNHNESI